MHTEVTEVKTSVLNCYLLHLLFILLFKKFNGNVKYVKYLNIIISTYLQ